MSGILMRAQSRRRLPADIQEDSMIADDLKPLARPISSLHSLDGNPRRGDVRAVMRSYEQFGQRKPIVALRDGTVIAGNHQLEAARLLGWAEIAVVYVEDDDRTAKAYALADNRTGQLGSYDYDALRDLLQEVSIDPALYEATGYQPVAIGDISSLVPPAPQPSSDPIVETREIAVEQKPTLADRFIFPPFSVLDARSGPWRERKRRWLMTGIQSEQGRADNLAGVSEFVLDTFYAGKKPQPLTIPSLSGRIPTYYEQKNQAEAQTGRKLSNEEFERDHLVIPEGAATLSRGGTSIFDPVLCELVYRWFSPLGGTVLDPFAGGSVRGVVAGLTGRSYVGIDLRPEQVESNRQQWQAIRSAERAEQVSVEWLAGDSREILPTVAHPSIDLVFSCPPYADLEVYSEHPADISNMEWEDFLEAYREIIRASVAHLAYDRFACFVVGEVRDRKGNYRNLIGETVRAFTDAGCHYYNEAILVTPAGSLPVRAGRMFSSGRKVGKTHQNVLVFVKGDGKRASQACGEVEVFLPEEATAEGDDLQA